MKDLNILFKKIILVSSASDYDGVLFLDGERHDCTSFLSYAYNYNSPHLSYKTFEIIPDEVLNKYNLIIFSGDLQYIESIIRACNRPRNWVAAFLPEGDVSLYEQFGIQSFSYKYYEALNAVDIILSFEEDKIQYYSFISKTPAVFVHVPLDENMEKGVFRKYLSEKSEHIVIYGDNNPNNPIIALTCAGRLGKKIRTVCIPFNITDQLCQQFNVNIEEAYLKLPQYRFLTLLGRSYLHIYPTRWIGSARESISCACVGTPCIGSDRSHTQRRLFPELACDIYDVEKICILANKLYSDKEYYSYIVDKAWKEVSFYNMANTHDRLITAYNIGLNQKKRKDSPK